MNTAFIIYLDIKNKRRANLHSFTSVSNLHRSIFQYHWWDIDIKCILFTKYCHGLYRFELGLLIKYIAKKKNKTPKPDQDNKK